jgi:hypothetical protein
VLPDTGVPPRQRGAFTASASLPDRPDSDLIMHRRMP